MRLGLQRFQVFDHRGPLFLAQVVPVRVAAAPRPGWVVSYTFRRSNPGGGGRAFFLGLKLPADLDGVIIFLSVRKLRV